MPQDATATAPAQASAVAQPTLEDKILAASAEALQVASIFSPGIAAVGAAGLSIEPSISAIVHSIIGIFHKHTGVKVVTSMNAVPKGN